MAETAVKMKMWYEVEGQTFPPTLRGLTDAIKLACEFATPTSMAHVRKLGEDGRVRLDLPIGPCERSPRGGHITQRDMPMIWKMRVDDVLKLTSVDSNVYGLTEESTVGDVLSHVDIGKGYYIKLRSQMEKDGTSQVPILVRWGRLENGHHRTKIACELGWEHIDVTNCHAEQTWDDNIISERPENYPPG